MAAERDSFFASLLRFTSRECLGFPETFTFFSFFFAIAETETERERESWLLQLKRAKPRRTVKIRVFVPLRSGGNVFFFFFFTMVEGLKQRQAQC